MKFNKKIFYKQKIFRKSNLQFKESLQWSFNFFKAIFLALAFYCFFATSFKIIFALLALTLIILLINTYKYIFLSILIFLIAYVVNILQQPYILNNFVNEQFRVSSLCSHGPIFLINGTKVLIKTSKTFNINDLINVKGQIVNFNNIQINLSKASIDYLSSLNIQNLLINSEINLIKAHQSIYVSFKNYLHSFPLILWFFLGIKIYKYLNIYKTMNYLNLTHLFVMSGFHVTLIAKLIWKIFNLLNFQHFFKDIILLFILWLISYILDFNASILRATLIFTLKILYQTFFNKKCHVLDLWSMTFLAMFLFWPYQIFALNFILTFISSLVLYLTSYFIKKNQVNNLNQKESKFKYFICLVTPIFSVYFVTLPISIYLNGYFNLFAIFYNFLFSPLILIYQLSTLVLLWSPLSIHFLTFLLLNWCKFLSQHSLVLDGIFLDVATLMYFYVYTFKLFLIINQFNYVSLFNHQ